MNNKSLGELALQLRAEGRSYNEISRTLGCSKATVNYYCSPDGKEKCKKRVHDRRNYMVRLIQETKHYQPCCDCGKRYPYWVMQFDHRGNKDFNVSDSKKNRVSIDRLKTEMAKCDLVCANCHAERTHKRALGIIV